MDSVLKSTRAKQNVIKAMLVAGNLSKENKYRELVKIRWNKRFLVRAI